MTKPRKQTVSRRRIRKKPWLRLKLTPKWLKAGAIAAVILLLAGAYVLAALGAVNGYKKRLATGTFAFSGRLTFMGQDFLSPLNSDMAFDGTYAATNPPLGNVHFTGNWGNRAYTGDAQAADRRLYFALSGPDMPVIRYRQGSFLLPIQAGREYSARIDESLYDNICAHNQAASLEGELNLYRTIKGLKLSPSPWVNFWASTGRQPATHVSANLSGKQLAGLWTALQQAAPPGCGDPNTLGFTGDDLQHVATHIDLYAGRTQDKLVMTLTDKTLGANATITFITNDYGRFSPRPAPANATDLNALYARLGLR